MSLTHYPSVTKSDLLRFFSWNKLCVYFILYTAKHLRRDQQITRLFPFCHFNSNSRALSIDNSPFVSYESYACFWSRNIQLSIAGQLFNTIVCVLKTKFCQWNENSCEEHYKKQTWLGKKHLAKWKPSILGFDKRLQSTVNQLKSSSIKTQKVNLKDFHCT